MILSDYETLGGPWSSVSGIDCLWLHWHLLFLALLLELMEGEYHINSRSFRLESTFWLWVDMISQSLKSAKYGMCKELAKKCLEKGVHVIVAVDPVSFVLVQGDYFGIMHILGITALPTALQRISCRGTVVCFCSTCLDLWDSYHCLELCQVPDCQWPCQAHLVFALHLVHPWRTNSWWYWEQNWHHCSCLSRGRCSVLSIPPSVCSCLWSFLHRGMWADQF